MAPSFRSLRVQFTGIMLAASLSFAAAVLPAAHFTTLVGLEERTVGASRSQLQAVAREIADLVLVEDSISLREATLRLASVNERWAAVFVVDGNGNRLASAPDGPPADLLWPLTREPSDSIVLREDGGRLVALATPLVDSRIGTLWAVIDLTPDGAAAAASTRRLALAMAVLTVAGGSLAFLLGRRLTVDLETMAAHARRVGSGDFALRAPESSMSEEVALLGMTLNEMSDRLAKARVSLLEQRDQLIQVERLAALGTFAAGAVHEVVNPLAGVAGCVRRLARPELPDERRRHYSDLALDGLSRATGVLRSLLTFARAEARPPEPARLPDLLDRAVALSCQGCPAEVVVLHGTPMNVAWPVSQVEQVLTNLLLNAVQAARSRVEVRWEDLGASVRINVTDDGPGIPAELQSRVFEPFFTTRRQGEGTGLGLSVSRSIAEALGGTVALSARADGEPGLTATLVLPQRTPGGTPDAA